MAQQQNDGWTPINAAPPSDGWTPVGATETNSATGITVPQGSVDQPDSAVSGFFRRGRDVISGAYHTVTDPPTAAEEKEVPPGMIPGSNRPGIVLNRFAKGVYAGEKQAAGQVKEQVKTAQSVKGDPVQKGLAYARAGVTAASMADPFATGPVTNVNTLEAEGRSKEAIGQGAFDALSLLVGGRSGREVSAESRLNNLSLATGATKSLRPLDHIMPDIVETVNKVGKPQTVGKLQDVIQQVMTGYDQKFNAGLATTKGTVNTTPIADALEAKARTLPRTASAEAQALRDAATPYRQPGWTPTELNQERMLRQGYLDSFYNKGDTGQMHAMRSNADTMIDKIVYDESKNALYDEMERQHPGQGFRELKQKQSSVLDMFDDFKKHVERLEVQQASRKAAPWYDKAVVSTSVHSGGPTSSVHLTEALKPGPLTRANKAVGRAFGPSASATARRAAVLSLPVSSIGQARPATVPPPPSGEDNEGPQ